MRNKYEGKCYRCGDMVAARKGHFEKQHAVNEKGEYRGRFRVQHAECAIKFRKQRTETKNNFKKRGPKFMANANKNKDSLKITTPVFRASFANVFKPRVPFEGQEAVYSVETLFDKKDKESGDMKWLKAAIKQVADAKWGAGKWPKNFKSPIKDGDEKELEGYAGHWFLTLKSKQKPGIVNRNLDEIIDPSEFYSGCYAKATIVVKGYSTAGNNGVACYLQNLQKYKDGEAFSGKRNAKDDFDTLEELEDSIESSTSEDSDGYDF